MCTFSELDLQCAERAAVRGLQHSQRIDPRQRRQIRYAAPGRVVIRLLQGAG
jgi:hypothetical protein